MIKQSTTISGAPFATSTSRSRDEMKQFRDSDNSAEETKKCSRSILRFGWWMNRMGHGVRARKKLELSRNPFIRTQHFALQQRLVFGLRERALHVKIVTGREVLSNTLKRFWHLWVFLICLEKRADIEKYFFNWFAPSLSHALHAFKK
jgi:hypothetical protein